MKAAIFDMDGTLFDTESIFQANWQRIARERSIVLPESFPREICGTAGDAMNRILERSYRCGDGEEIQRLCKRRVAHILAREVPLKPGCREILEFFRRRGFPMAVGSSSPLPQIRSNLTVSGTASFFSAVASGDEVTRGKPAPDIFLLAAKRLHVPPEECFVFEDSPNGIRAACAARMVPILIPDLLPVTDDIRALPQKICGTLLEARDYLAEILPSPERPPR